MLRRKKLTADLCVVGGGLAGICAAIAAARNDTKVVLMHERPVLGGNSSSEIRMVVCGAKGSNNRETGIIEEIMLENCYRNPSKNFYIWDTVLYDFVIREKNITLLLNCTCMDAMTETGSFEYGRSIRIKSVTGYQMTTQTFFDIEAKYFADCSGDSILAPLSGAEFRMGRESRDEFGENTHVETPDSMTMGMSCLLECRETTKPVSFIPPEWSTKLTKENFENRSMDIHRSFENFWYLELGGDRDTIHDTAEIASELIPLAVGTYDYIKNSGNCDAQNWDLDFLGFLPGKRESRRMVGEYIINSNDIIAGVKFKDTVAFGGWPVDDHFPDGFYHKGVPNTNILPPAPYCIPYRCMYSKNVDNLFFAGRNISMTHMAMSSVRVMGTCALLGQAAGTAASVAIRYSLTPHGVYEHKLTELQKLLMDSDCLIPTATRKISALCNATLLLNGNEYMKNGEDRQNGIYKNKPCGGSVKNGSALKYVFETPADIGAVHITFDSDLDRVTLPGDEYERRYNVNTNTRIDSAPNAMPETLCKEFIIEAATQNGTKTILHEKCNRKRAYHIPVCDKVYTLKLTPVSNWGGTNITTVFSFDF